MNSNFNLKQLPSESFNIDYYELSQLKFLWLIVLCILFAQKHHFYLLCCFIVVNLAYFYLVQRQVRKFLWGFLKEDSLIAYQLMAFGSFEVVRFEFFQILIVGNEWDFDAWVVKIDNFYKFDDFIGAALPEFHISAELIFIVIVYLHVLIIN